MNVAEVIFINEEHAAVVGQTHAHMQPWFRQFGPSIDLPPSVRDRSEPFSG